MAGHELFGHAASRSGAIVTIEDKVGGDAVYEEWHPELPRELVASARPQGGESDGPD